MTQESDNSRKVVETEKKMMSEYGQITIPKKWRPDDAEAVELRLCDDGTIQIEMQTFVPTAESKSVVARGGDER